MGKWVSDGWVRERDRKREREREREGERERVRERKVVEKDRQKLEW